MGIHSRDYIRETPPGKSFGSSSGDQWAIKFLIAANVAVFVLQNMTGQVIFNQFVGGLTDWFALSVGDLYPSAQVWRLVTYGFCHSPSVSHIFFNMFVLWMFGRSIEPILGSREFLAFYLGGVVISGVCHVALQAGTAQSAGVLGASGGVMAVVFLTAMIYPRMTVLLFFILPIELRWLAVMYAVADVAGMVDGNSGVAHAAHLGGAAFGVAYKYYNWRVLSLWDQVRNRWRFASVRRARPNVRLYQPSKKDLDDQVDAILSKIHEQGEESLTDKERELLKSASRRYRDS